MQPVSQNKPLNFWCVPKEEVKDSEEKERHTAENVVKGLPAKCLRFTQNACQWHRQNWRKLSF